MSQRSRTQPQLTTGPGSAPYGTGLRAVTAASLVFAYLLVILGDTVRGHRIGNGMQQLASL